MQPSHEYFVVCTQRLPRYGVTFVHVLTYLPTDATLPKMVGKEEDQCKVLQYLFQKIRGIWSNFVGSVYCVVCPGMPAMPCGSLILNDQEY